MPITKSRVATGTKRNVFQEDGAIVGLAETGLKDVSDGFTGLHHYHTQHTSGLTLQPQMSPKFHSLIGALSQPTFNHVCRQSMN